MIGAEYSRDRYVYRRTSAGSAKIAPSPLCTGRSAALAAIAVTAMAKADRIILRGMADIPD
jgi:hypothetical protein